MNLVEKSDKPIGGKYSENGFANFYNEIRLLVKSKRETPSILNIYKAMKLAEIEEQILELDSYDLKKDSSLGKNLSKLLKKREKLKSKLRLNQNAD